MNLCLFFSSKDLTLMSPLRPIHTLCFASSLQSFWTCSDVVFVVLVLCFSVFSIFMYYVFFLSFLFRYTPLRRTTFSVAKQSASFTHSNRLFTSNDVYMTMLKKLQVDQLLLSFLLSASHSTSLFHLFTEAIEQDFLTHLALAREFSSHNRKLTLDSQLNWPKFTNIHILLPQIFNI